MLKKIKEATLFLQETTKYNPKVGIILGTIEYDENQYRNADLNEDENVDVLDIVLIVEIILNP